MKIIKSIFNLNKEIKDFKNIGFVPTMGGLHDGHISLIKTSQKKNIKTIVSIFVNPTQFNNINDFKNYPRNIKNDISTLKKMNVDYLFYPNVKEIYKLKSKKFVLKRTDKILCAKHRPGHFEGVLDVMNRLMTVIKSKNIYMGEKDYQQIFLINKFLSKKFNVNIKSCPTIRRKNSFALSTRNMLLNKKSLSKVLQIAITLKKLKKNSLKFNFEMQDYKKALEKKYDIEIDYLEFRDEKKLKLNNIKDKYRLFVAYSIDNVRLIDNF